MKTFIFIISAIILIVAIIVIRRFRRNARNQKLMATPLSDERIEFVENNVPLYKTLPREFKTQLGGLIQVFLADKKFEGCAELEITDEIKVTIAAQACILLLNRKTRFFPKLRTIFVYPGAYVANQTTRQGFIEVEGPSTRLGESWQNGPVVLAWDNVKHGAWNIEDGHNVVMHEFAHQLDQEDGSADGAPILENRSCYGPWAGILSEEYQALQGKIKGRKRSVMDRYGATNPAEFFAVATETFFEKPCQMHKKHPDLYNELKNYYKLDPANWK